MDVVSGDFSFDVRSGEVKSSVKRSGFLDPELANEGQKVDRIILSDGEQVAWTPPQVKPVMPDWRDIKSLAKYFDRHGYQTWPCWFYHPTEPPVLIKDAEEAFEKFRIKRRKSSERERATMGVAEWVWDTPPDCEWQPAPYAGNTPGKYDPNKGEQGKNYMAAPPNPQVAQNALLAELIPTVTAAVVTALKTSAGMAPPSGVDSAQWAEFLAFKAWKETQAAVEQRNERTPHADDEERAAWEAKAKEAGIKVDGRWSLDKLRKHVLSELEAKVREVEQQAGAPSGEAA